MTERPHYLVLPEGEKEREEIEHAKESYGKSEEEIFYKGIELAEWLSEGVRRDFSFLKGDKELRSFEGVLEPDLSDDWEGDIAVKEAEGGYMIDMDSELEERFRQIFEPAHRSYTDGEVVTDRQFYENLQFSVGMYVWTLDIEEEENRLLLAVDNRETSLDEVRDYDTGLIVYRYGEFFQDEEW